jgi:hypothetical protein
VVRPIPWLAPVTSAVRPAKSNSMSVFPGALRRLANFRDRDPIGPTRGALLGSEGELKRRSTQSESSL